MVKRTPKSHLVRPTFALNRHIFSIVSLTVGACFAKRVGKITRTAVFSVHSTTYNTILTISIRPIDRASERENYVRGPANDDPSEKLW